MFQGSCGLRSKELLMEAASKCTSPFHIQATMAKPDKYPYFFNN